MDHPNPARVFKIIIIADKKCRVRPRCAIEIRDGIVEIQHHFFLLDDIRLRHAQRHSDGILVADIETSQFAYKLLLRVET